MAFPYLLSRALYRIRLFLYDWYVGSFYAISRVTVGLLEYCDKRLALWITVKNIFQPLYQDHTFIGRILGFIFRSIRICIGLSLYTVIIAFAIIFYILVAAAPIYILYWGFGKQ